MPSPERLLIGRKAKLVARSMSILTQTASLNHPCGRIRIEIHGIVQGVGFRPFVCKRATKLGLSGWVRNTAGGVTLEVQGPADQLSNFCAGLESELPPAAVITSMRTSHVAIDRSLKEDEDRFRILASSRSTKVGTAISADIAVCDQCVRELRDPRDRRFGYPFITCTDCGPRFSIVVDMPFDRELTTMRSFHMCETCQREYNDPDDRRFHAQTIACSDCGPGIWFATHTNASTAIETGQGESAGATLDAVGSAIRSGQIIAIKGIGGFHLACDPMRRDVIQRLRLGKHRGDKPFAIMVGAPEQVDGFAICDPSQRRLLCGPERPIVLLHKRSGDSYREMLDAVAPGHDTVGVMLPYSPLHALLVDRIPMLVMTSGNLADEPIARTNTEAVARLGAIADGYLFHDRDIETVCDDSVIQWNHGTVQPIRRARGFAPLPITIAESGPNVLAVGGDLKSTICVTKDRSAFISQHIGDLGNHLTYDSLRRTVDQFQRLFRVDVAAIAADLHPGYGSASWAQSLAKELHVPWFAIQHHHAHAVSLHTEHSLAPDDAIIACCFDGTGYGTDGAVWGGEFLVVDGRQYKRIAHLRYCYLPGGDAGIKRPDGTALAMLDHAGLPWDHRLPCVEHCSSSRRKVLRQQLQRRFHCCPSSSMGRLFDSVSSLIGICQRVGYEGQAAIELESSASGAISATRPGRYRFELERPEGSECLNIDFKELLSAICQDHLQGMEPSRIAAHFHHAIADMIGLVCQRVRSDTGIQTVGLTGGVFQNVLLTSLVNTRLIDDGFHVLTHRVVPAGDGGISLGQAIIARHRLMQL